MYALYLFLGVIIYFSPLNFNLDAITGLTGLVAILEGAISDKDSTSNILNISILYIIIIVLAGDYISYNPLFRGKEFIKFTERTNFIATLIRSYFLGILYVKSFRTFLFFIKEKNDKN